MAATRRGFLASFGSGLLFGKASSEGKPQLVAEAAAAPGKDAPAPGRRAAHRGRALDNNLSGYAIFVDDFVRPDDEDDTPAIRAAIDEARRSGGPLYFAARLYDISDTIEMPSGLNLVGAGRTRLRDPEIPGTTIRRTRDVVGFAAKGISVLAGAHLKHSISIRHIPLH